MLKNTSPRSGIGRHKGLRFAFIIGALFYGVTILIYIICWMVFKPRPTFNP